MKTHTRRLLSVLLAFFCLTTELFAPFDGMLRRVQGAVPVIERISKTQVLDGKYCWKPRFYKGSTTASAVNCDDLYAEQFLKGPRGDWGSAATAGVASLPEGNRTFSEGEAPGCYYSNIGSTKRENGNWERIDMKLSIVASYGGKSRYDFRTPSLTTTNTDVNPGSSTLNGVTYSWKNEMGRPCVSFLKNSIGLRIYAVDGVDVRMSFYDHNTGQPMALDGHATLSDIDGNQSISFPADSNIKRVCLLDESEGHLTISGNTIDSSAAALPDGDRRGDISYFFENTDSVKIHFDYRKKLEKTLEGYQDSLNRAGSKEKLAETMKKRYYGSNGVTLMPNYDGGEWITAHATFTYEARVVGRFVEDENGKVEKRVGPAGCSWEEAQITDEDEPYWISAGEEFNYLVRHWITPRALDRFDFDDFLQPGLVIDGEEKVQIYDQDGKDIRNRFEIRVENKRDVYCVGKLEEIKKPSFSDWQVYTFVLRVHRDPNVELPLGDDGSSSRIWNNASLRVNYTDPEDGQVFSTNASNWVWVGERMLASLSVEKKADKYEWKVGDKVSYTVTVTQNRPGEWAAGVTVRDTDLPDELQLLDGFSVEGKMSGGDFVIKREGKNGWKCTGPRLNSNEPLTIRFQCLATEASNGAEWENYVYASAVNLLDPDSGVPLSPAFDREEIWVNSPALSAEKTASRYEYRTGEEIEYQVTVTNARDYTLAKHITVEDVLPEGLELKEGALPQIEGLPKTAAVPRDDGRTWMDKSRTEPTNAKVERTENGWRMTADYFPSQTTAVLRAVCVVTGEPEGAPNGTELVNTVSVSGENIEDTDADERIFLNEPKLSIEKSADHYEWQVGEAVAYQVKAENRIPGTIARNVVIRDAALPEGLTLQGGAEGITVSGLPETLQNPVRKASAQTSEQTEGFRYTEEVPIEYEVSVEDTGWEVRISDLPAQTPVTLTFSCLATEEANGKEAVNRAEVSAANGERQEDEETIYVNTAALSIEKEVRRTEELPAEEQRLENEYRVGETAEYEVRIKNVQPGSIARNVVVEDTGLPEYLTLLKDITADGVPEGTKAPSLSAEKDGWSLQISELPYDAPVTVVYRCEIGEAANGKEILNIASAAADNAQPVTASQKIWINTPKLSITKEAGEEPHPVEEPLSYTIEVRQEAAGCVAGNVVLEDIVQTPGVQIDEESIVLTDENGEIIEGNRSSTETAFVLSTERSLVKEENYLLWDPIKREEILQEAWNPPGITAERVMRAAYTAKTVDFAAVEEEITNLARANSKEQCPAEVTKTVRLLAPKLSVIKESDQTRYPVGSVGYYHILVEQTEDGASADQVVLEDEFSEEGANLQWDTLQAALNRKILSDAALHKEERGFVLETGVSLKKGDRLDLCYQVVFSEPSLVGKKVKNTVRARAENTGEREAEVSVDVEEAVPLPVIEKTSDKEQYRPGETADYTVTVTQKEPNAAARNVVIEDRLQAEEASLLLASVTVTDSHGKVLPNCEVLPLGERSGEGESGGCTVRTGADLNYLESLTLTYQVRFQEDAGARQIENRAAAAADNFKELPETGEEVSTYYMEGGRAWAGTRHEVELLEEEPPKETESPKPTEPPKETDAPKPTEPPKETDAPKPTEPPKQTDAPKPTEPPKQTETKKPTEPPKKPTETAAPKETPNQKSAAAETGDASPVEGLAAALCISLCVILWLLEKKIKK